MSGNTTAYWCTFPTVDDQSLAVLTAQWDKNCITFNTSKTKLVTVHHLQEDSEISPAMMGSGTLNKAFCLEYLLELNPTSGSKDIARDPWKWSVLFAAPENTVHLLSCSIFTKVRSEQKLSIAAISGLELTNPCIPVFIEFRLLWGWVIISNLLAPLLQTRHSKPMVNCYPIYGQLLSSLWSTGICPIHPSNLHLLAPLMSLNNLLSWVTLGHSFGEYLLKIIEKKSKSSILSLPVFYYTVVYFHILILRGLNISKRF